MGLFSSALLIFAFAGCFHSQQAFDLSFLQNHLNSSLHEISNIFNEEIHNLTANGQPKQTPDETLNNFLSSLGGENIGGALSKLNDLAKVTKKFLFVNYSSSIKSGKLIKVVAPIVKNLATNATGQNISTFIHNLNKIQKNLTTTVRPTEEPTRSQTAAVTNATVVLNVTQVPNESDHEKKQSSGSYVATFNVAFLLAALFVLFV